MAVPAKTAGMAIGSRIAPMIGPERFRGVVLGLLTLAGLGALAAVFA